MYYTNTLTYWLTVSDVCCVLSRNHIHISVEDVNEFDPEWKDQTYVAEVIEGSIEKRILQLDAADADGSEKFSKICHYRLLTPDVPFEINTDGMTRCWLTPVCACRHMRQFCGKSYYGITQYCRITSCINISVQKVLSFAIYVG